MATRYRFRFLLQEFDLPPGETLIGRGPDCRITLVDPLVSRHHARVRFEAGRPVFEDLGSRNGSRVNGRLVRASHPLKDGDRLRIGTQELVFSEIGSVPLAAADNQTGLLVHCADCQIPYPDNLGACPSCGSTKIEEENTLSGILDDRRRQNWALEMLVEMLRKAINLGREADAERIALQASSAVDDRLRSPTRMEAAALEGVCLEVIKLSQLQNNAKWARWILDAYRRAAHLPSAAVVTALEQLTADCRAQLVDVAHSIVDGAPVNKLNADEQEGLRRMKSFLAKARET